MKVLLDAKAENDFPLWSRAMASVLVAQFLSALADNVLFIAAIALLKDQSKTDLIPLLQTVFIIAYIVLAPVVGPIADSNPKGRVMFLSNALKLGGAGLILAGLNPLIGYALAGVGAAVYSPAKYGILSQLFSTEKLVRANGLLEGSTIAAILLGTVLGGTLADHSISFTLLATGILYILAAGANLLIPRLPPEHKIEARSAFDFIRDFWEAIKTLARRHDARFTLIGAGIFWGTGAVMRLALFAWVPAVLLINDNKTPAMLMATLSIGIVFGALAAGKWISLAQINRVLPAALALGVLVTAFTLSHSLTIAGIFIFLLGVAGGIFVVPLNALLMKEGHATIGAGHAFAVQNLIENIAMLATVALYAALMKTGYGVVPVMLLFSGAVFFMLIAMTIWRLRHSSRAR